MRKKERNPIREFIEFTVKSFASLIRVIISLISRYLKW